MVAVLTHTTVTIYDYRPQRPIVQAPNEAHFEFWVHRSLRGPGDG